MNLDKLSEQKEKDDSDLEGVAEQLKGLESSSNTSPDRADRKGPGYVRGRLYGSSEGADRSLRSLSKDCWEAYGESVHGSEFHSFFQTMERLESKKGKVQGKRAVEELESYTE